MKALADPEHSGNSDPSPARAGRPGGGWTRVASRLVGAATLLVLRDSRGRLRAACASAGNPLPERVWRFASESGGTFQVADAATHPELAGSCDGVGAVLAVPLVEIGRAHV